MTLALQALRFVSLFSAALVAGAQVFVLLVVVPAKRGLAARASVEMHVAMLGHLSDRYLKPAGITSGLTAVLILVLDYANLPTASVVSLGAQLLGLAGVVITSRFFNVPTNARMEKWSLDAIPEDYPQVRRRWDRVHALRTASGVVALTGSLLAQLAR